MNGPAATQNFQAMGELLLLRAELAGEAGDCAGALDDLVLLYARPADLKLTLRADRLSKRCLSVARREAP